MAIIFISLLFPAVCAITFVRDGQTESYGPVVRVLQIPRNRGSSTALGATAPLGLRLSMPKRKLMAGLWILCNNPIGDSYWLLRCHDTHGGGLLLLSRNSTRAVLGDNPDLRGRSGLDGLSLG